MNQKTFSQVMDRFINISIDERFDLLVAIANGGIIPAGILNQRFDIEFRIIQINYRDFFQQPRFDSPQLINPIDFEFRNKKILLVDDRIKTGSTIAFAKELLKEAALIKTFAVNGNADYALYNENCFRMPWLI